jgi:hypothetical protein
LARPPQELRKLRRIPSCVLPLQPRVVTCRRRRRRRQAHRPKPRRYRHVHCSSGSRCTVGSPPDAGPKGCDPAKSACIACPAKNCEGSQVCCGGAPGKCVQASACTGPIVAACDGNEDCSALLKCCVNLDIEHMAVASANAQCSASCSFSTGSITNGALIHSVAPNRIRLRECGRRIWSSLFEVLLPAGLRNRNVRQRNGRRVHLRSLGGRLLLIRRAPRATASCRTRSPRALLCSGGARERGHLQPMRNRGAARTAASQVERAPWNAVLARDLEGRALAADLRRRRRAVRRVVGRLGATPLQPTGARSEVDAPAAEGSGAAYSVRVLTVVRRGSSGRARAGRSNAAPGTAARSARAARSDASPGAAHPAATLSPGLDHNRTQLLDRRRYVSITIGTPTS